MRQRSIIIKEPGARLRFDGNMLEVKTPLQAARYIGIRHIKALYVNHKASFDMREAVLLARLRPLYFIDHMGYLVARVSLKI